MLLQVFEASDFPVEIFPSEEAAREQALREELQSKAARLWPGRAFSKF
jgi:hypothetical protein